MMFDIYTLEVINWALMEYRETLWLDFQIKLCDEALEKVRAEIKRLKKEGNNDEV